MKSARGREISYTLLRIVKRLDQLNKKNRHYGTDYPLHEAEIHLIKAVKENEGMHVTGLAEIMEVSKGAISQILMKLEKKKMIFKKKDPANRSRVLIHVTPKGETAYHRHEELHNKLDAMVFNTLSEASTEEKVFLEDFFHSLETSLNAFED